MKIPVWMIFLGFCAAVAMSASLLLVYVSNHSRHGLVREDYYEAGLHLDEQRLREAGFDSLKIHLALIQNPDSLVLEGRADAPLDSTALRRLLTYRVKLVLQRPDDPGADRDLSPQPAFEASPGALPRWSIATSLLRRGRWNCQVIFENKARPMLENSFTHYAGG